MAAALVTSATSEKLRQVDWSKNIEVCEFVSNDPRVARDVVKAIRKRLGNKSLYTQLFSVTLLEMLMNNIRDEIYQQVIDTGVLDLLVKMVKKKVTPILNIDTPKLFTLLQTNLPVRERIFLLLDATQMALGGASGKFPQYYSAYYHLVKSGVQFPQGPTKQEPNKPLTLQETISKEHRSPSPEEPSPRKAPDESIIQKASNSLDVLKDVLDALDPRNPEGGTDEFTLDLVEQCSFQKQRVVNLVMTSQSETIVSKAIELNDQLQKVLKRHEALIFRRDRAPLWDQTVSSSNRTSEPGEPHLPVASASTDDDEEEPEQLYRRLQKGKARAYPDDETTSVESSDKWFTGRVIKPVDAGEAVAGNALPPPPSKHVEREKFFQERKVLDTSVVSGHLRGISIGSHSASSSRGASVDFAG